MRVEHVDKRLRSCAFPSGSVRKKKDGPLGSERCQDETIQATTMYSTRPSEKMIVIRPVTAAADPLSSA